MKEIKFKAWYDNKIYEVISINFNSKLIQIPSRRFPFTKEVLADSIMQYTGFKDKNGEEIYKDDILKILCQSGNEHFMQVIWNEKEGGWDTKSKHGLTICAYGFSNTEKVGNIYENSELLK
jgi:uncharacterized phage protein (TIGR01671 family)